MNYKKVGRMALEYVLKKLTVESQRSREALTEPFDVRHVTTQRGYDNCATHNRHTSRALLSNRARSLFAKQASYVLGVLAVFGFVVPAAHAQGHDSYPSRPITLVVPFAAGGPTDSFGRLFAERLADGLGQPVLVVNRAGAGGIVGSQTVANSKPDGYTLLVGTAATHGINLPLYKSLPYHPLRDFEIISLLNKQTFVLLASAETPTTLQGFIKSLKEKPMAYFYSSAGSGSTSHLYGEIFKIEADVEAVHVPFKGAAPALQSILAGETQFTFETFGFAEGQIRSGRIRALAVGGDHRSVEFPNVPTFAEAGMPQFSPGTWQLLVAPAGTPREIITRLNAVTRKILANPQFESRISALSFEGIKDSTPESATQTVKSEIDKFTKVIDALGISRD